MAVPYVNGRLHLTGVHQKPPASLGEGASKVGGGGRRTSVLIEEKYAVSMHSELQQF